MSKSVIFFLNNLAYELDTDSEDDTTVDRSVRAYEAKNLAATYIMPLQRILSSHLNQAGSVHSIYVNFGTKGYYKLNPHSNTPTQTLQLRAQLNALFQARDDILTHDNKVVWRKMTDLSALISNIPPISTKIGCYVRIDHLPEDESTKLKGLADYIRNASKGEVLVFVVGQVDTQEIKPYIDDFVKVSEYDVMPYYCLDDIIYALEKKWGIN